MSDSRLLRGTLILTAATFLSKFLGMIYVFPFYALVGQKGGALFSYGYNPYTIFISLATMGVPLAVSKFVSKYNAMGDYHTGRRLFKTGLFLMSATGLAAFLLLYTLAPFIAPYVIEENSKGNTVADVTMVIRMVSVALLVVPVMSLIRGFFQGHQSMGPTAVSQVVEQIIRIAFILGASFLILRVWEGEMADAVGWSTFAAFIGAIAGLLVLVVYWIKRKKHLDKLLEDSTVNHNMPLKDMYKELLSYAGPFVFVGLAIPLFQLVDQFTFNRTMDSPDSEALLGIFNFYSNKLVLIPVSLATAFGLTLIPTVTSSFTEKNVQKLHRQIGQALQIGIYLILPAGVGLSVLAFPAYGFFFEVSEVGGEILRFYAPLALFFGLFTITAAILQGINAQRFAVRGLALGWVLKVALNVPLIMAFETYGSIAATYIGFGAAGIYNLWKIRIHADYDLAFLGKRVLLMAIFTAAMGAAVLAAQWLISPLVSYDEGRMASFVVLILGIGIGGTVYLLLGIYSNLAYTVLGERVRFLRKRRKKSSSET